jgi:hypothetical protein
MRSTHNCNSQPGTKAATVDISWGLRTQTHYATPSISKLQTTPHFSVMKPPSQQYKQQLTSKCMVVFGIDVKVASCMGGGAAAHSTHHRVGHLGVSETSAMNEAMALLQHDSAAQVGRVPTVRHSLSVRPSATDRPRPLKIGPTGCLKSR